MLEDTIDTAFVESSRQTGPKTFFEAGEVRLYVSTAIGTELIGGADFGNAITNLNIWLANELATLLRKAGYTKAVLVLDAEESR